MDETPHLTVLYYEATTAEIAMVQAGLPDAIILAVTASLQEGGPTPEEAATIEVLSIGKTSRVEW